MVSFVAIEWLVSGRRLTYGTMYGMEKTTIYLPGDLKRAMGRLAAERGVTEAEIVREALRTLAAQATPRRPRLPLFKSGKPRLADNTDRALEGFGEA